MSKKTHDWLPGNHTLLYALVVQLWAYLTEANRLRMGFGANTPQGSWIDTTLDPARTEYIAKYTPWENEATRTPVMTTQLVEAQEALTPLLRQFAGMAKASPLVTNDDLQAMGLPKRTTGGGGHNPVPASFVSVKVELPGPRVIRLHFQEAGSEHKAKPAGVYGAEIRWGVLDESPTDISSLPNTSIDTHTPFTLEFEEHDRGKRLYFALRWENTTGEKGPWSDILNAIIP
jgi:hypothetical protein